MEIIDFLKTLKSQGGDRFPVIFVGHGSPMNAITDNIYRDIWIKLGTELVKPKAILCISAHWLTEGVTAVTMMDKPKTIYDFYGFPSELYEVQYSAPGAPAYAKSIQKQVKMTSIQADFDWGLDHGTWSVLRNFYPAADIPVFQLSLDYSQPLQYHYNLAKELAFLRQKGVLIIGSGNLVHNLGQVRWEKKAEPYDWAIEFDAFIKKNIEADNPEALINYTKLGPLAKLAHPTNDHYLPLIYILGLRDQADKLGFFNEGFELGSLSMRSLIFG